MRRRCTAPWPAAPLSCPTEATWRRTAAARPAAAAARPAHCSCRTARPRRAAPGGCPAAAAWRLPAAASMGMCPAASCSSSRSPATHACRASTHERVYAAAVEMDASQSPLGRPASLRSSPLGGSAASSPTRQLRALRSVQFGGGAGEEEAVAVQRVAVQRVGRRPSFTQQHAVQYDAAPAASPSGRRVLREAEGIAAKGPGEEALRDRDAWEVAAVQPAPRACRAHDMGQQRLLSSSLS